MFTSIEKVFKIQTFFYHNPSHAEIKNSVRFIAEGEATMVTHLMELKNNAVSEIIDGEEGLSEELERFGIRELRSYFLTYPSTWYDLKRKIHSFKLKDTTIREKAKKGTDGIDKTEEEDMLHIFLRLGRRDELIKPYEIESIWRTEILKNKKLIKEISNEPSLMDSSHGQLDFLHLTKKSARTDFIRKMIQLGVRTNVALNEREDIETHLQKIITGILPYLKSIFEIEFPSEFRKKTNIHEISEWITKKIWNGEKGVESKNAWMLVKAIRAWGGYEEIVTQHEKAKASLSSIPEKLQKHGIVFEPQGIRQDRSYNDTVDVYYGKAKFKNKQGKTITVTLEYRLKSLRSTLLKLWSEEDYNNIDALRDTIGVAIVWPNNLSEEDKLTIVSQSSLLFADKGYMAKNKGLFVDTPTYKGARIFRSTLQESARKPLGSVAQKKREKSSGLFKNASFSGFTKIGDNPIGFEMQFYDESSYEFWKTDHYTFDPLKVVSAWSRGSWFLTPRQLLNTIRTNIHRSVLETKLKKLPQGVIQEYVDKGSLIIYRGANQEIYCVPRQFEGKFLQKFTRIEKIEKGDETLREFIATLSEESNGEIASQPLHPDQSSSLLVQKGNARPSV